MVTVSSVAPDSKQLESKKTSAPKAPSLGLTAEQQLEASARFALLSHGWTRFYYAGTLLAHALSVCGAHDMPSTPGTLRNCNYQIKLRAPCQASRVPLHRSQSSYMAWHRYVRVSARVRPCALASCNDSPGKNVYFLHNRRHTHTHIRTTLHSRRAPRCTRLLLT